MYRSKFWAFALVLVTAIWGWSFVAKHNFQGMAASCLNSWLFLLGGASLLPFALNSLLRIGRKDWLVGVAAGGVLFVAFAFQTTGIQLTSPSNAGFITGLAVVFTPLILYFVSGEKDQCPPARRSCHCLGRLGPVGGDVAVELVLPHRTPKLTATDGCGPADAGC
ncbi:DMT family transporter [Pseudomonas sp. P1B16]|uniref:DMT family transporter n=1 Tax=Pseudomonas sp. P1B16 TaxID=2986074 RepID=UPI002A239BBD|nr:DMT family transporter [Pseudomonas sp. P1B16]WPM28316.1 DMT family transporter [Pseudomonas sp. P1B16]